MGKFQLITKGLIKENPTFVLLLGMCPTLATTTSAIITFSGGEPLMQTEGLIELVKLLEGFDIAVYTGHELFDVPKELLERINYIKTGSFKEELKTTVKPFVGSTNQEFRRLR